MWVDDEPGPTLEDEWVEHAEALFGVKLPAAYVELCRRRNGGQIEESLAPVHGPLSEAIQPYVDDGHVTISSIFGVVPSTQRGSIYCTPSATSEWDLPQGLILLDGDGHTWLALDYRQTDRDPPIVFIVSASGAECMVAQGFDALLASLVSADDFFDENDDPIGGSP